MEVLKGSETKVVRRIVNWHHDALISDSDCNVKKNLRMRISVSRCIKFGLILLKKKEITQFNNFNSREFLVAKIDTVA